MNQRIAETLLVLLRNETTSAALMAFGDAVAEDRKQKTIDDLMNDDPRSAYGNACVAKFAAELVQNIEQIAQEPTK